MGVDHKDKAILIKKTIIYKGLYQIVRRQGILDTEHKKIKVCFGLSG